MTKRPELWKKIGLRGTPSLLISEGGTGKKVFLEGVTQPENLTRALDGVRQAPPGEKKKQTVKESHR